MRGGRLRRLIFNLRWGWHNGRKPPLVALMFAAVGVVLTWTVAPLVGPALTIVCVVYSFAWGSGHNIGHRQATLRFLDQSIEQMEQVVADAEEQFAHNDPRRLCAAEHLAYLKRLKREGQLR